MLNILFVIVNPCGCEFVVIVCAGMIYQDILPESPTFRVPTRDVFGISLFC